ncbi:MAG: hypothetical protein JXR48_06970 [Candidatus Delongbacteria bacterium]|nr:hypothetical protein [Candidatus Delongbacteria bacterium]
MFYLLYKIKPEWVRVKKLKIFNFHPYIFLYEEKYYEQNLKNEIENNKFKLFK